SGDVVDARFGELTGVEAVRRALRLKEGEFRVELNVKAGERTVFEPWGKLVLEEMVSDDEALSLAATQVEDEDVEDVEVEEEPKMMASETREGPRYCPVCSKRYVRGTVCSEDGAQLLAGVPPNGSPSSAPRVLPKTQPPPMQFRQPPPSRTGLYVGIGVAVLVLAGAGAFFVVRERQRAAQAAQDRAEAEQAAAETARATQAKRPQGGT